MRPAPLSIGTETVEGVTTVYLDGALTLATAEAARRALVDAVEAGRHRLVVELGAVEFLDSSGLGALIAGLRRARQAGGDLRIAGAQGQALTVFRLTNLDRVLALHPSADEARRGW